LTVSAPISVVIPARNEEARVALAVRSARAAGTGIEVLVVDGGSRDRTRHVAAAAGARVVSSAAGRGVQLDRGAREATGAWLVFLHADTWLEQGWATNLLDLPRSVVGGAFRFAVDSPRRRYRVIESGVALRCRLLRLPFGDQGIFVRRETYAASGGFPPLPLMEDVAFVRRLSRLGRLAFPRTRAITSARRWERAGIVSTTLRNWGLLGLYAVGLPPKRLAKLYG
jgi:rSAM/selenodomain-associated transferase 2